MLCRLALLACEIPSTLRRSTKRSSVIPISGSKDAHIEDSPVHLAPLIYQCSHKIRLIIHCHDTFVASAVVLVSTDLLVLAFAFIH